jgi:nitrogen fixation/metabolism regulation signal transduction histidine kinase
MKSIGSWSIATKIIAFLVVIEILFLSIVISSTYFFSTKLLKENSNFQISELAPLLNTALITPLLQKDYATVRAITSEITESKFITQAIIFDKNSNVIAKSSSKWFSENDSTAVVSTIELHADNLALGMAEITLSKNIYLDLQKRALQDTIYVSVVSILVFLLIAMALARYFSNPIIELLNFTKKYDGQDFSKATYMSRNDEIGELYRAYEVMLDNNRKQINALNNSQIILKERKETIDDALQGIRDAFALFDAEDNLILCNSEYVKTFTPFNSFEEIRGITFEELVRSSLKHKGEVIEPAFNGDQEAWVKERIRRHRNPREAGITEVQLGPEKWVQVRERRTNRGRIVGIRTDISELKMIQRTLEEAVVEKNQLLKSMATLFKSNSMGSMVSSLAHEINSPLGAVSLNSELLKMELTEYIERHQISDLDKAVLFADQIFLGTQKTSLVVSRLRSLFTHGEDKFELFDLTTMINDILGLLRGDLMNEKVVLHARVESSLNVFGDVSQIQMVIMNATRNAMQALKTTVDQRAINVEAFKTEGQVRVVISDNGPGFNDSILKNGFELFKTTKSSGMGVGMWLSRAIMENHNGSINATNNKEGGACITLIFYDKKSSTESSLAL